MITDTGKEIIAKYLMGTAPAYASYIALGCGAVPRPDVGSFSGASSSSFNITVASTEGIWIGGLIKKTSGTGTLQAGTVVTGISSTTVFTVNLVPTVALSGAAITIEPDPAKDVLDFEMFRVPITSRGYINDSGVNKIVFTAELPTEDRYEISEIGIFSAGLNPDAGRYDSKTLYTFSDIENWQYSDDITLSRPEVGSAIFPIINESITTGNNITATEDAIQTNSNNAGFLDATRAARYERCRYLNNIIMLRGNTSHILPNSTVADGAKHLQISSQNVDFTRNSTADLIKIAFSLISETGSSSVVPTKVRILMEFSNDLETQYAKVYGEVLAESNDLVNNRYIVIEKRLDELSYSPTFSWTAMTTVKLYVSTIDEISITNKELVTNVATLESTGHGMITGETVSVDIGDAVFDGTHTITAYTTDTFSFSKTNANVSSVIASGTADVARSVYFVALDAVRLDNVGTVNPLYGMTGYSIVQSAVPATIVKNINTNNYVEFRVILDVL